MKKSILIASAAILLVAVVVTVVLLCRDTGKDIVYSPAPISLKLRNKLDKDFAEYIQDYYEPNWYSEENVGGYCKIYGSENGYVIFNYSGGMHGGGAAKTVGDLAFGTSGIQLYVYKKGEFIELADAYEQGLISRDAIVTAREYHNQILVDDSREGMIAECCPGTVYRFAMWDIEESWRNMGNETFGTWYTTGDKNADWRYYNTASDFGVNMEGILLYFGAEQEQTFTTVTVGGCTFSHPTGFQMYRFNGEELIDLMTLDEIEPHIVDKLRMAEQQHNQCNDLVFGEGWDG